MNKISIVLIMLLFNGGPLFSQHLVERNVRNFNRIIAGDKVNLYLSQGDDVKLEFEAHGVEPYRVITEVQGGILHIYLDGARLFDKHSEYRHGRVDAYVTFRDLEKITIKGDGEIVCNDVIQARDFKIVTYGANRVSLEGLIARSLTTKAYGENTIEIHSGSVNEQKLKLYGENTVDALSIGSDRGRVSIFGASDVKLAADHRIRYNIFGEGIIRFLGDPMVSQGVVFGEKRLYQYQKVD